MRILVDENVPAPVLGVLRTLLPAHEVRGVREIRWTGRADHAVLRGAAERGFDAFLTRDDGQLDDPAERAAVHACGLHHIRYGQTRPGRAGLGRAIGAVLTAITRVADDLAAADGPRLVRIAAHGPGARYDVTPATGPPGGRGSPGDAGRDSARDSSRHSRRDSARDSARDSSGDSSGGDSEPT